MSDGVENLAASDDSRDADLLVIVGESAMHPPLVQQLKSQFAAVSLPQDEHEREAFYAEHGASARRAVTSSFAGLSAGDMDAMPHLELIANFGVGYDSTDVPAATERGIKVTNTPDVLNDAVADLGVGLLIDVMRGLSESDRFARESRWTSGAFPLRREVTGSRVGILGLGRIGQAVADRLVGFRCEVGYHNRSEVPASPLRYFDDLHELARWSDALVVVVPGGAATKHLVDASVLEALGADSFLVNIARGSVVDESALIDALTDGVIAGAGLDVYENEPHIPSQLRDLPNVVLAPHIASGTHETRQAMADAVLANLRGWASEKKLVTPVN